MMTKNILNATEVVDLCTKRLAALKKYVPNTTTQIPINGEIMTVSNVVAVYQDCLDARTGLDTQRALVKAAMGTTEAAELKLRTTEQPLRAWVVNTFGPDSQQAHDFGFPPRKKPVRTVVAKSHAVAQSKATRAARHTLGPKQKDQIKGTVTASTAPAAATNGAASH